jgi:hypothetical protein
MTRDLTTVGISIVKDELYAWPCRGYNSRFYVTSCIMTRRLDSAIDAQSAV